MKGNPLLSSTRPDLQAPRKKRNGHQHKVHRPFRAIITESSNKCCKNYNTGDEMILMCRVNKPNNEIRFKKYT